MIDTNYLRSLTEIDEWEWYTPGQQYLDALSDAADEIDQLRKVVAAFRGQLQWPVGQGKDECKICYGIGLVGADGASCTCCHKPMWGTRP